ncbi:MAG: TonB-dependent receptor [Proteiniphilum sp.]|jgi:TonB-linked SusC/RagA family outer membrane protein|nr:TonB-dependent receptor [Proteiniphilum sp.]
MKRKLTMFLSLFFLGMGILTAQTQIRGTVVDVAGEPVIGATIQIVGTSQGTVTDFDGNFRLSAPANASLEVSYVGMLTQVVAASPNMRIVLETDTRLLDEVMVVAYGTARKSTFTGSAATVDTDQITNRSIANVSKALDGTVPGVQTTLGSGQPGSSSGIVIRGFGSINASQSPLYVVDGIPYDGSLNSINPNDIASLTVLKDASASSLYGSRAANGVVMITTKSGQNTDGKVNVNFKTTIGVASRAIQRYDVMNTQEYLETAFQSYKNDEIFGLGANEQQAAINAVNRMKGTVDGIFGVNEQYNPYGVPVSELFDLATGKINPSAKLRWTDNWMDEVIASSPLRQEYQFDVSGGNAKMKTLASFNYLNEEGLLKTTSFDRFAGRVSTDLQATDWFRTSLSANVAKTTSNMLDSDGSATSNVWYSAEQMAPIYPIWERDANGVILKNDLGNPLFDYGIDRASGAQQNFNSIATLYDDRYYDSSENVSARGLVEFNTNDEKYGAFQGLTLTMNLGADYVNGSYTFYYNPLFGNAAGSGRLGKEANKTFSYTFNQVLNWNRTFDLHSFDLMFGHEFYSYKFNHLSASKTGFPFPEIYELAPGSSIADATSYENNETLDSYFSRLNYDYMDKYYLSASYRRDGSSRFHKDFRWGDFWSLGASWRVSEESFMDNVDWIDNLTVKASYGTQGNNRVGLYAWQAFYDLTWSNANSNGAKASSVENMMVSWEKNASFNTGFDAVMLNSRLAVGFDWYTRKTTDMLLNKPLPFSSGFTGYNDNVGDMKNWGFDLSVGYDFIRTKDLVWNVTAMGSKVNNEVIRLTDEQDEIIGGSTIIRVGEQLNTFFMARSAGVDPATGDQLYWVFDDKDDEHDRSKHYVSSDKSKAASSRVLLGSRIPDLYGSLSTTLAYKGFDFSMMATYSLGGKIYDYVGYNYTNPLYIGNNWTREVLRAWKQPGDITDIPRMQKGQTHTLNDRALVDASYFAFKNIAVGYTFQLKNAGIESIRFFAQGDNLAIFSARQGLNPQYNFSGSTDFAYTPNRVISGGLNIKF